MSFSKRIVLGAILAASMCAESFAQGAPNGPPPSVAVYGFSAAGIAPWWGSNVDPGGALADLLTDRLVNLGTFSVIDRSHLQTVLKEQDLGASGDVTPATETQLGRMLGVKYLLVGRIIQFEKTGGQNGLGGILPGLGAVSSSKVTLHVSMQVIEASSGRIVQAIDQEDSNTATSFAVGGLVPGAGAGYSSQQFQGSVMGKLITTVADNLSKKVDPTKMASVVASAPAVTGHVVAVTPDGDVVLNAGSEKGMSVGMTLTVIQVKQYLDPDSKKMISTEIPHGSIQVTSVSKDSAIAKKMSGTVKASDAFRSE